MPEVYNFPPVALIGNETTISRPGSMDTSLSGTPYYSQSRPTRTTVTASIATIGPNLAGNGYIEQLKIMLDGKLPLVRMVALPEVWYLAVRNLPERGRVPLEWYTSGLPLNWSSVGPLEWSVGGVVTAVTVGTQSGWDYADLTGLPANRVVGYPSEIITADDGSKARLLQVLQTNASGEARAVLDGPISPGEAAIGTRDSKAYVIMDWGTGFMTGDSASPREMKFKEVFSTEYTDGFTEVTVPWN